jgi:hypothetical protein
MDDFTFTNKAYDLLLSLKDEGIINPRPKFDSIKELRLAIDIVKEVYPLFANADNKTILDFVEDTFKERPSETELIKANHIEEEYRPIQIQEILPGTKLKIIEESGEYFHTFWTYADTKQIIPKENTTLYDYNRAFMYIWEKAKQGKVFIKNTYQYRIDDIVSHLDDPISIGTIKARRMNTEYKNEYAVFWSYCNEPSIIKPWIKEFNLTLKNRLEAMPMKTIEITNRRKGKPHVKTYQEWTPEQYEADKKEYGYASDEEAGKCHAGWIKYIITYTGSNRKPADKRKKHKSSKQREDISYLNRKVCVKHFNTGVIARVDQSLAKALVTGKGDYDYVDKKQWRQYLNALGTNRKKNNVIKPSVKNKDPKYFKLGKTPIQNSEGKTEWIDMGRRGRRSYKHKQRKGSFLVKEQFVTKIIPEVIEDVRVKDNSWESPWANQILKVVRPAHTVVKRILTRVQPHKEIKVTEEVLNQRTERSILDKTNHASKRFLIPLTDLKEEFRDIERRNEKASVVEKWTTTFKELTYLILKNKWFVDGEAKAHVAPKALPAMVSTMLGHIKWPEDKVERFIRYIRLTTHGVFGEKKTKIKKVKQPVEFETTKFATKVDYSKLKYNLPEVNKVIYIKLINAGNDNERVGLFKDNNIYLPTGDLLCSIKDVQSWKYKKDKEYQDLIIDEGGGITKVGVKFRRKDPEYLQKYFERQKKLKNDKRIRREAMREVSEDIRQ